MQLDLIETEKSIDPSLETKICSKCNEELPVTSFTFVGGQGYRRTECKKCASRLQKEREFLKATTEPPPKNYKCPICKRSEKECAGKGGLKSTTWVLDHNHKSGKFRGWLCHDCNRAIGCFKDDANLLKNALEYMSKN